MGNTNKRFAPEVVSGYELEECEFGNFSVVKNTGITNLVYNPSFEYPPNPVKEYFVSATTTLAYTGYPYKGIFAARCTCGSAVADTYIQCSCAMQAGTHFFSAYVKGPSGAKMTISIEIIGVNVFAQKSFVATGEYQRVYVSYTSAVFYNVQVVVRMLSGAAVGQYFDTDCWQFEKSDILTTYCDGSMAKFVIGHDDHYWTGIPNDSPSIRRPSSNAGGEDIDFKYLGIKLYGAQGLGIPPIENLSNQLSTGGEFFQKIQQLGREFTLNLAVYGSGVDSSRNKKHDINTIFNPVRAYSDQPILLRFHKQNSEKIVNIPAFYQNGLSGNIDNYYQERISLTFKQFQPVMENDQVTKATGTSQTSLQSRGILKRDSNGDWSILATINTGRVYHIEEGPDGKIYVCGSFEDVDGYIEAAYISRVEPSGALEYFAPINNTVSDLTIYKGYLYIVGNFTNVGGDGTKDYFVKRSIYADHMDPWEYICTPNAYVTSIDYDYDGKIFISGVFSSINATTATSVAYYDSTAGTIGTIGEATTPFTAGNRCSNITSAGYEQIRSGNISNLYVSYEEALSFEDTVYHYNDTVGSWTLIGAFYQSASIVGMSIDWSTGNLLVYGGFTKVDSVTTSIGTVGDTIIGIARYRFAQWYQAGTHAGVGGVSSGVYCVYSDRTTAMLYVVGQFTSISGGIPVQPSICTLSNNNWRSIGIELSEAYAICATPGNNVYVGTSSTTVTPVTATSPIEFTNEGTTESYPVIKLTAGASTASIYGIKSTYDNTIFQISGYKINPGEWIVIDMRNINTYSGVISDKVTVYNNYGQDLSTIAMSGTLPLRIAPGVNRFELHQDNGSDITMEIFWNERYASIEDI